MIATTQVYECAKPALRTDEDRNKDIGSWQLELD